MPYLDGFQLARLLRAEYQEPLKLIAVTGPGEAQDPAAWRKAGFDAQVVMPVDPALVQSMIETLLIEGSASGNPKLPPSALLRRRKDAKSPVEGDGPAKGPGPSTGARKQSAGIFRHGSSG
jgi:DNA-binding response OmpR family regulator